jgi:hypothetical protein
VTIVRSAGEIGQDESPPPQKAGNTALPRPTEPQRRYLTRGLAEAGGKLPLFDADGREVSRQTVEACIAHGWAEPWMQHPIKSHWLVCRLTPEGYRALGHSVAPAPSRGRSIP